MFKYPPQVNLVCEFKRRKKKTALFFFSLFLNFCHFQTWDPWNVPFALGCALRVFRLLSQVTLLRFVSVRQISAADSILYPSTTILILVRHPYTGQLYSIVSSMSKEHVLSAGFDINTPDNFGRTCLHAAASGG